MKVTTIGLDTAKRKMHLIGCDEKGSVVFRKSCKSDELIGFLSKLDKCVLALEACGGSSYWGRKIEELGFSVRLVCPLKVCRQRTAQKNDYNDCLAIVEVAHKKDTRFIEINKPWQQDLQSLHRIRTSVIKRRVELTNQIHGLALEYGIILPDSESRFKAELGDYLEDAENDLSEVIRSELAKMLSEIEALEKRDKEIKQQLEFYAEASEDCKRILKVPGVGILTATAFLAAVGSVERFKNGRELSAWLGLVPRQFTTGGKVKLGRISKRGDSYLRQLLVHGGRSVLVANKIKPKVGLFYDKIVRIEKERGYMKAAVAVANRNVRVMYSLLKHQSEYGLS